MLNLFFSFQSFIEAAFDGSKFGFRTEKSFLEQFADSMNNALAVQSKKRHIIFFCFINDVKLFRIETENTKVKRNASM
jgi:hypothetical protein